jgi:hypothetical protein
MRERRGVVAVALASLSLAAAAGLLACFDLLHSTKDIETACEVDAAGAGCPHHRALDAGAEAGADAGRTDFCAWTPDEARENAVHACSWLGACETPLGDNAFGPCFVHALMAFDCQANPNHPVQNEAHELWDCLRSVRSCDDVDSCVFGGTTPTCESGGLYTSCVPSTPIRVRCEDGGVSTPARAYGENCALWGQTCAFGDGDGVCAGATAGVSCSDIGCDDGGTGLHWCAPASEGGPVQDLGLDCASNGAQACAGFPAPDAAPQWVACLPVSDAGVAGACPPDMSASCDDAGRAHSCLTGVSETLDCARLLGTPTACRPGALDPFFDWTSPCAVVPSQCDVDSCGDAGLSSCERGATLPLDCASQGLGACHLVNEPDGAPRAACAPPAR